MRIRDVITSVSIYILIFVFLMPVSVSYAQSTVYTFKWDLPYYWVELRTQDINTGLCVVQRRASESQWKRVRCSYSDNWISTTVRVNWSESAETRCVGIYALRMNEARTVLIESIQPPEQVCFSQSN
jgi:hypothetical protein